VLRVRVGGGVLTLVQLEHDIETASMETAKHEPTPSQQRSTTAEQWVPPTATDEPRPLGTCRIHSERALLRVHAEAFSAGNEEEETRVEENKDARAAPLMTGRAATTRHCSRSSVHVRFLSQHVPLMCSQE
jgi:hypothetical protein